jgi:PTH1 family peptidyl-tRNA hydrolase
MVLAALQRKWQAPDGRQAFSGRLHDVRLRGPAGETRRVMLLEPYTYMNLSGRAVQEMAAFYKAEPQDLLVVLDDMALPTGRLRFREGGSAGGHKGLADILAALGTGQVPRLRIGIGVPPGRMDAADFVLSRFSADEAESIEHAVAQAAEAVEDWVFRGVKYAMDTYNRKSKADSPDEEA